MIETIVIFLLAGILTGLIATMFGFGGGFVVVPLLFWLLPLNSVPKELAMHMAVGTSLMLMFVNMFYASWLHYTKNNMNVSLLKKMLPLVAIGAICGAIIASLLNANSLKYTFVVLVFLVLLRNLNQEFGKRQKSIKKKPTNGIFYIISFVTGTIATLLGIGGSVIIVPFFRHYGLSMKKASAVANAVAVPSGLIGSIVFLVAGIRLTHLPPYSTGYLYWPAFIFIFIGSVFGAKVGVHLSGIIPDTIYGKIYCFLLVIVIISMLSS